MRKLVCSAVGVGALCLLWFEGPLTAQTTADWENLRPRDRVVGRIDEAVRIQLKGNLHPLARAEFDVGRTAPDTLMERMTLVLLPDDAQRRALDDLVRAQQSQDSPLDQRWLTPQDFGARFGVSENDLDRIVNWLEGNGFTVEPPPAGLRWLVFSGTARQVESAFHTEIHEYRVNGELHHANAADPEIPAALAAVVGGVVSLHDFLMASQHVAGIAPDFTSGSTHYMAPSDFATIYDAGPLYSSAIDGAGQSIAIVGRSNLALQDIQTFRSTFGLAPNTPTVIVNGPDPGIVSQSEQSEAELDVEWAGAVARKSAIQFVVSKSTSASDGVTLSAQYIVSHNLAPVVSMSFSGCESALGTSGNQFWNSLWQQAASYGMTVLVSSGDSGAAGCDGPSATGGSGVPAVNGLCSSPYSTCVGGTQFNDAIAALSWSQTNTPGTYASALGYIPEAAWNSSGLVPGGSGLWASGGGASAFYSKPSWQTGNGVPPGNFRYVPDVALASSLRDGYLMYLNGQVYVAGGTSASTPSFAGLMALTAQRRAARLGNANPVLYALAALQARGGANVFHDITVGNNSVPGVTGCTAGAGYDPVTGLGSVDANLLVNSWATGSTPAPSFQVSAPSSTVSLAQGGSTSAAITVAVSGGFRSAVSFSASGAPAGLTAGFTPATLPSPGSGSSTLALAATAQTAPGTYQLKILATGGGITLTTPLQINVTPKCSYSLSPTSASVAPASGTYMAAVTATAGCAWTAASNASWITLAKGNSGTGSGQLSYSVTANPSAASRTGSITIAGLTFSITQAFVPCGYIVIPGPIVANAAGFSGTVMVTAQAACTWTASSNVNWIAVQSGATGTGNGIVSYQVAANTANTTRNGNLVVAGTTLAVTQAVRAAPTISSAAQTAARQ